MANSTLNSVRKATLSPSKRNRNYTDMKSFKGTSKFAKALFNPLYDEF